MLIKYVFENVLEMPLYWGYSYCVDWIEMTPYISLQYLLCINNYLGCNLSSRHCWQQLENVDTLAPHPQAADLGNFK